MVVLAQALVSTVDILWLDCYGWFRQQGRRVVHRCVDKLILVYGISSFSGVDNREIENKGISRPGDIFQKYELSTLFYIKVYRGKHSETSACEF